MVLPPQVELSTAGSTAAYAQDVEAQLSATRAALREAESNAAYAFQREITMRVTELEEALHMTRSQLSDAEGTLAKGFAVSEGLQRRAARDSGSVRRGEGGWRGIGGVVVAVCVGLGAPSSHCPCSCPGHERAMRVPGWHVAHGGCNGSGPFLHSCARPGGSLTAHLRPCPVPARATNQERLPLSPPTHRPLVLPDPHPPNSQDEVQSRVAQLEAQLEAAKERAEAAAGTTDLQSQLRGVTEQLLEARAQLAVSERRAAASQFHAADVEQQLSAMRSALVDSETAAAKSFSAEIEVRSRERSGRDLDL